MTIKELAQMDVRELFNGSAFSDRAVKIPTKTTINLAMHEESETPPQFLVMYIVLAIVALFAFVKCGFIDQQHRLNTAKDEYAIVDARLENVRNELQKYSDVEAEYLQYSKFWMLDESNELYVGVDRAQVLDLIERCMMSRGTLESFTIQGNKLAVNMSGMNLEQISEMFSVLEKEPIVKETYLNLATTAEDAASVLEFSVTIELQQNQEG